jgi:hypothetical protein
MNPNGYPFLSRRQILEKIAADSEFASDCIGILQDRYARRAEGGPGMGWMASHAATATKLAAKVAAGEATDKELVEAAKLASRYSKQLARAFRDRDLAARPELGAQAAVFGVGGSEDARPAPAALPPATGAEAPPAKRRGRPKGSKNKPKVSPGTLAPPTKLNGAETEPRVFRVDPLGAAVRVRGGARCSSAH